LLGVSEYFRFAPTKNRANYKAVLFLYPCPFDRFRRNRLKPAPQTAAAQEFSYSSYNNLFRQKGRSRLLEQDRPDGRLFYFSVFPGGQPAFIPSVIRKAEY
jgi:hypothetical protein